MRVKLLALCAVCLLPMALFARGNDRDAFLDAEGRFLSGNYALALERYDDFLREWPDSSFAADARFRRAVSLYRLGRADEAWDAFSIVQARYRSSSFLAAIPFWMGVIRYETGSWQEALDLFDKALAARLDTDTLRQTLQYAGRTAAILGFNQRAMECFEQLGSLPQSEADQALRVQFLSELYTRTQSWEKLIALREAVQALILPQSVREPLDLRTAQAYIASGNEEAARALLSTLVLSQDNTIALGAIQLMVSKAGQGFVSEYIIRIEDALRSDPAALADFWRQLGISAWHDTQYEVALSYFKRVASLLPASQLHPDVPLYMAEIAWRDNRKAEALLLLQQALERAADRDTLYRQRIAWYAIELEDWNAVLAVMSGYEGRIPYAAEYLSWALYKLNKIDQAYAALQSTDSGLSFYGQRLSAELNALSGRDDRSLQELDALLSSVPSDYAARLSRMALLFKNSQYTRIVSELSEWDSLYPNGRGLPQNLGASFSYMAGISLISARNWEAAVQRLDTAFELAAAQTGKDTILGDAAPWAAYYRAWALYRLSRFEEASLGFNRLASEYTSHELAASAAFLSAWCSVNLGDYQAAVGAAKLSADIAASKVNSPRTTSVVESPVQALARASFLEGTLRPLLKDWDKALAALDRARNTGLSEWQIKASFERAVVLDMAGRVDAADAEYMAVSSKFGGTSYAERAAFARGDLMFRASRWKESADRFNLYRQQWPSGTMLDAALYFGASALAAAKNPDAAILLWERLLSDFSEGSYRFATFLSLGQAYMQKQDWTAAFRVYTTVMAEYPDRAKSAGANQQAETLRYLLTGLPLQAAQLHAQLSASGGVQTPEGRRIAVQLLRFYVLESSRKEAGLSLMEDLISLSSEDPASSAQAWFLKGEYFASLQNWEQAAEAFIAASVDAAASPSTAKTSDGKSLRDELVPAALYKAAEAQLRSSKRVNAEETVRLLQSRFPQSVWTTRARSLMETR